ncbi:hypothetical protein SAMN05216249_110100 [Acetitomaculum ruminis DSM 5522]|uniref:Uncharacterized protein n=1 Tax=Acetitomaculum ruminis DSM 5522 TaxID=1120918 RepID=A0A1I0YN19_9FIRM|nr:hypothetical protein [Acetitomaculum ruminis]SFB14176.1 hypothetical protein SAMN05216249_110100 [Acetitomaculum ruminis DSM 5522]
MRTIFSTSNTTLQAIDILLSKHKIKNINLSSNNSKLDLFVRQEKSGFDFGDIVYKKPRKQPKMISKKTLDEINLDLRNIKFQDDVMEVNGVFFKANQIPKIRTHLLKEVKANDNVMDFGKNNCFRYTSDDGKEHCAYTSTKGIHIVYSEYLRGAPSDDELNRYLNFWNNMNTDDPVYINLSYSDAEIEKYLSEAGIEKGFFTVKMGDQEETQFYSSTKTANIIQAKWRYDIKYKCLTSDKSFLKEFEPGSIIKIGGVDYVVKDNHTLDVPYGADIYDIQYPKIELK